MSKKKTIADSEWKCTERARAWCLYTRERTSLARIFRRFILTLSSLAHAVDFSRHSLTLARFTIVYIPPRLLFASFTANFLTSIEREGERERRAFYFHFVRARRLNGNSLSSKQPRERERKAHLLLHGRLMIKIFNGLERIYLLRWNNKRP